MRVARVILVVQDTLDHKVMQVVPAALVTQVVLGTPAHLAIVDRRVMLVVQDI